MVEKGVVIGEMRPEQQIPGGNDSQKYKGNSKSKGKDWWAFVVSHPSDKNKRVARMGHPRWFEWTGRATAGASASLSMMDF
jgi:hypothetical protein